MGNRWTINAEEPAKTEKYEWHVPNNDQQHVEQTTTPGDLRIKPKDISLIPTLSPERSGVQWGAEGWNDVSAPGGANAWYVIGAAVQEDD